LIHINRIRSSPISKQRPLEFSQGSKDCGPDAWLYRRFSAIGLRQDALVNT
jgi:hypothetical protein